MDDDAVPEVVPSFNKDNEKKDACLDDASVNVELALNVKEEIDKTVDDYDAMLDYEAFEESKITCQYCHQRPCYLEQGLQREASRGRRSCP